MTFNYNLNRYNTRHPLQRMPRADALNYSGALLPASITPNHRTILGPHQTSSLTNRVTTIDLIQERSSRRIQDTAQILLCLATLIGEVGCSVKHGPTLAQGARATRGPNNTPRQARHTFMYAGLELSFLREAAAITVGTGLVSDKMRLFFKNVGNEGFLRKIENNPEEAALLIEQFITPQKKRNLLVRTPFWHEMNATVSDRKEFNEADSLVEALIRDDLLHILENLSHQTLPQDENVYNHYISLSDQFLNLIKSTLEKALDNAKHHLALYHQQNDALQSGHNTSQTILNTNKLLNEIRLCDLIFDFHIVDNPKNRDEAKAKCAMNIEKWKLIGEELERQIVAVSEISSSKELFLAHFGIYEEGQRVMPTIESFRETVFKLLKPDNSYKRVVDSLEESPFTKRLCATQDE